MKAKPIYEIMYVAAHLKFLAREIDKSTNTFTVNIGSAVCRQILNNECQFLENICLVDNYIEY
jgi:hypothetical protein